MEHTATTQERKPYGLIIDGLNAAPASREQIERARSGGVVAMNLTIIRPWAELDFEKQMAYLGRVLDEIDKITDLAIIARSTADIKEAQTSKRVAIIMGSQNSSFIENDISLLSFLQRIGFRILQPTYSQRNRLGDGAFVPEDEGLTELGRQWVHEMNRLGMIIDMSHSGNRTSADAIAESSAPVIFSHANALAMCNCMRNKPDDLIRAIAEKGGVIGACAWPPLLKHATRPSIEDYFDHVEYLVNLVGIEHVSFASDLTETRLDREEWDRQYGRHGIHQTAYLLGAGDWYTYDQRSPEGYESIAKTKHIWDGLLGRGFSENEVEKIMGGNLLRVFHEVWGGM